jgi:hypothetical protein
VITGKRVVFNVFEEPQGSTADRGPAWPQRQMFAGFSIQFNKWRHRTNETESPCN